MVLEFWMALVDITEDLLAWLSAKEVQAAKVRLKNLKTIKKEIELHLEGVENDLNKVMTEIELLEDYINSEPKEL